MPPVKQIAGGIASRELARGSNAYEEAVIVKKLLGVALIVLMLLPLGPLAQSADGTATHQPGALIQDAQQALDLLKAGHARYISGELQSKESYAEDRNVLSGGQKPFAVVLTCSDSRVAPEICFDQKLGDLFTIRNAGNIADDTVMGSIEYAVAHLKTPLIFVVGHSKCGAVTASFEGGEFPPELQSILDAIKPACDGASDVDSAVRNHIANTTDLIQRNEIVRDSGARVVCAYYDITTGGIEWMDDSSAELEDAA